MVRNPLMIQTGLVSCHIGGKLWKVLLNQMGMLIR